MHKNVKYKNGTKFKSWIHANRPSGTGPCQIIYQILSTQSLRKCIEISLENLYVDIGY